MGWWIAGGYVLVAAVVFGLVARANRERPVVAPDGESVRVDDGEPDRFLRWVDGVTEMEWRDALATRSDPWNARAVR